MVYFGISDSKVNDWSTYPPISPLQKQGFDKALLRQSSKTSNKTQRKNIPNSSAENSNIVPLNKMLEIPTPLESPTKIPKRLQHKHQHLLAELVHFFSHMFCISVFFSKSGSHFSSAAKLLNLSSAASINSGLTIRRFDKSDGMHRPEAELKGNPSCGAKK